ncbi:MAG: penicillin acylase family protein [Xanthomonadales bacterium]|jgi:penicillin amidase|nr:penicillin acylase family protein [Xanthomonadales bacterium]
MTRRIRWLGLGAAFLLALTALLVVLGAIWLRGSLPRLDGTVTATGLEAPVRLHRDAQGLLTVQGQNRADIAFGLGFAHAQDRFFQMDLQRRNAAGELAALFGDRAIAVDRTHRLHRFRARARRNLELASPGVQRLIGAYRDGVNAGLASLDRAPFEYTLLGADPEPWRSEDAYLTLFTMILRLQDAEGRHERGIGLMHDVLPADLFAFFTQQGGRWDAPLFGEAFEELPVPETPLPPLPNPGAALVRSSFAEADEVPGSNNWAVSGALTTHGGALVADDMHLGHGIPNIWYRAYWNDPRTGRSVGGATLPGLPFLVVGSNERVAWGFTNTQGDWIDVIELEVDEDGDRYRGPAGWLPFRETEERIEVKDGAAERLLVRETVWGPVIGSDHRGRLLALRWTAHDPEGANLNVTALELAEDVRSPVAGAFLFGIPQQNLVLGDADGNIAWTIAGPVPRRQGFDGQLPGPWHDGQRSWDGYYGAAGAGDHPSLVNPETGRLWTANARVVSGELFKKMGFYGAALGARQQQIRDRLMSLDTADVDDMLALQLDDEARFLNRWRERALRRFADPALLEAGGSQAVTDTALVDEARRFIENWSGRASADDVGYRLVRGFRLATLERVGAPLETLLRQHDPEFRFRWVSRHFETPAWTLLEARPAHLLNPDFTSWAALERDALLHVIDSLGADGTLANDTWGERNRLRIEHPLAGAIPVFGARLKLPDTPMSGDSYLPRVQGSTFGASQRFGVSPGREAEGYFHMPAGQSAHPLSPFFSAGHEDWVEGRKSTWLPGPPRHELEIQPR